MPMQCAGKSRGYASRIQEARSRLLLPPLSASRSVSAPQGRTCRRQGPWRVPGGLERRSQGQHALGRQALTAASDAFAARVAPVASELRNGGMSLRRIAAELTKRGVQTMRGGEWTAMAVRNVLLREAC